MASTAMSARTTPPSESSILNVRGRVAETRGGADVADGAVRQERLELRRDEAAEDMPLRIEVAAESEGPGDSTARVDASQAMKGPGSSRISDS